MLLPNPAMADRKRALVVDDDEPIRTMLTKILERQSLEVDVARDGQEAIDRITGDNGYSVILLDLMMPRVDGFQVLDYLSQHHPAKLARTIVASAIPESEVRRRFDGNVYRIHAKPFDMARLLGDVKACVN